MMISVRNNDFDSERNPTSVSEAEENGVANDGNLNLNAENSVPSGNDLGAHKPENDETRVLSREGGDARVLGGSTDCHENVDSGYLEGFRVSSGNDGVDGDGENELRVQPVESKDAKNEVVDAKLDDTIRWKTVGDDEDSQMDGTYGDFRLESRSDSRASVSNHVDGSDMHGAIGVGSVKVSGYGFELDDMVWGKVKSHPWWPGHLFNEAFASSSVRRTRRDGHVLVAFFGDSSYGWFDPMELIPYDPHYAEKSQQTNSRNFMKAVEESVDEASRRSALGVTCRCRNPFNFRPTNIPGYVAVDVVDYDPGAVYSVSQIRKARESFRPADTLSFIKQFAATPRSDESKSLDFIKNKATALAYRRSIFEEFDETYAQAFGQQPVRPAQLPVTDKVPSRAPLSGPLVMAETLGRPKSSKAAKPKDASKRDRYLFKRRDEAADSRTTHISQSHAISSPPSDLAAASYVFQKRDLVNDELATTPVTVRDDVATSADNVTPKDGRTPGLDMPPVGPDVSGKRVLSASSGSQDPSAPMTAEVRDMHIHGQVTDSSSNMSHGGMVKKKKKKRPAGELSSEKPTLSEKKKVKKRKIDGSERSSDHPERPSTAGSGYLVKTVGKPNLNPIEDSQLTHPKKDGEMYNSVPQQVGLLASEASRDTDFELREMLADLQGLALNPLHGLERNRPAIVRQFFLKFRSIVFLKSSGASLPPFESDPIESRAVRSQPTEGKSSKLSSKHVDPTKVGRKRVPSERQEEIAAKKAKKISEVKSLGAEKRALLKNPEMQRADGKAKVGGAPPQQPAPSSRPPTRVEKPVKKVDRPARVEEPTFLIMKFQSGSSLPSLVELKARFARFGPLDTSLSRVFYSTNTCRVAFLYKQDAHVAYRYAVGSKSLFSNVRFMLKPVSEPQQPTSEPATSHDSFSVDPRPPILPTPQVPQLRSILKKPTEGDEPSGPPNNGGAAARAARVRFNMGEDKGGARNEGGPFSSSPSTTTTTTNAMDVVSENKRFMSLPPLQPQFPPFPTVNHPQHHVEVVVAPRNNVDFNLTAATGSPGLPPPPPPPPPTQPPSADISQQMMSLLTRCHDLVTNVKSVLGYVPYHPL